eukprot:1998077-Amphidinium_carterae.1
MKENCWAEFILKIGALVVERLSRDSVTQKAELLREADRACAESGLKSGKRDVESDGSDN